jgi:hypothetical protein
MQINNKEILILVSFEEQDKEYFEHIIRNLNDRGVQLDDIAEIVIFWKKITFPV